MPNAPFNAYKANANALVAAPLRQTHGCSLSCAQVVDRSRMRACAACRRAKTGDALTPPSPPPLPTLRQARVRVRAPLPRPPSARPLCNFQRDQFVALHGALLTCACCAACDETRPCPRCVRLKIECYVADVKPKKTACINCHKAKTACDGNMPCGRCTRLKARTCPLAARSAVARRASLVGRPSLAHACLANRIAAGRSGKKGSEPLCRARARLLCCSACDVAGGIGCRR